MRKVPIKLMSLQMTYLFKQDLTNTQNRVNDFLNAQLPTTPSRLREAMHYALLLGGKRVRPFLVYATGKMLGAEMSQLDYAAAAIEAIHAYSLIHDDLPPMDNDNLRRGHPTCHLAFDEATAILAGDALQPFAFELLTQPTALQPLQKLALIETLAQASGIKGMCLGQSLDLQAENKQISLQELEYIHSHKTGALLIAAVKMGFLCSSYFSDKELEQKLTTFAKHIGLAFQVQDDILDIEGNLEDLGKTVGADLAADKSTYPKLLGLQQAKEKAQLLYEEALSALAEVPFDTSALKALANFIIQRKA